MWNKLKELFAKWFKNEIDKKINPEPKPEPVPEPVKPIDKDIEKIKQLIYNRTIDTNNFEHGGIIACYGIGHSTCFQEIANLPQDFVIVQYSRAGATVSIPKSDPTKNLSPEGEGHMLARRLIFISFFENKMVQVEDQNHNYNSHIGESFTASDMLLVLHCRQGKIVSRSNLWTK
jgi:hypothetical protein